MNYQILTGDNRQTLKTIPDNSIDAIVTDPPYGIDFLGKAWDANVGALETYRECLRVLKPGGHIVAFSAARTYHHLAVTLEQAGFEIRDQIMWIYSSGFPKSQDIGKSIDRAAKKVTAKIGVTKKTQKVVHNSPPQLLCSVCNKDANARYSCVLGQDCGMIYKPQTKEAEQWAGWGTNLKPAHEPICLARKPSKLSIAQNCRTHGVGALNIDATRIPYDSTGIAAGSGTAEWRTGAPVFQGSTVKKKYNKPQGGTQGNSATFKNFSAENTDKEKVDITVPWEASDIGRFPSNVIGDIPDYQKYFYCPKVGRAERHIGFDLSQVPVNEFNDPEKVKNHPLWDESIGTSVSRLQDKIRKMSTTGNNHPTVKPIELMKYLIKLITPAGGTVLDPFNGSGSTGCAAVELGHPYIGCELDPKYVEIAQRRIEAWYAHTNPTTFRALFTTE